MTTDPFALACAAYERTDNPAVKWTREYNNADVPDNGCMGARVALTAGCAQAGC